MMNGHDIKTSLNEIAEASGTVIRKYFRQPLALDGKDAPSPIVTIADREAEQAIRAVIESRHPDHKIIGEEFGSSGSGDTCWVLDPIDGTIAFACGKPIFCTLVGFFDGEVPIAGMIDQPITGERWISVGGTTTLNDQPCKTSAITELRSARLGTTDPGLFSDPIQGWFSAIEQAARITSYGGDGYAYGLVASGHLDMVIESGLAWHDVAALICIIEGAGGTICDFQGQPHVPGHASYDVIAASSQDLVNSVLSLAQAGLLNRPTDRAILNP